MANNATPVSISAGSGVDAGHSRSKGALIEPGYIVLVLLLAWLYWRATREMITVWKLSESYYSHGFLVPLVSAFFVWLKRHDLAQVPRRVSPFGYVWVAGASLMLLAGTYLGFRVIAQLSLLPMIVGLCLLFQGAERTKLLWFPIAYLIFMIPIPPSLTQSVALRLKLLATEGAVTVANWATLPMVRDGSFIYWPGETGRDMLQVGEVCGGLRSLIALLAFGALMAYISKTRNWARVTLLALSAPIAIVANVFRILLLCVVGYFFGSEVAAGRVHDVSGYLIFVVAFLLFFLIEKQLRRFAPQPEPRKGDS